MHLFNRSLYRYPYRLRRPFAAIVAIATVCLGAVAIPAMAADPGQQVVLSNDFESSYAPWGQRGPVTLALADEAHGGAHSLSVTGRTANWNGPATSVSGTA